MFPRFRPSSSRPHRPFSDRRLGTLRMAAALALLAGIAAWLCLTEPPPRIVPFVGIMSALPRAAL